MKNLQIYMISIVGAGALSISVIPYCSADTCSAPSEAKQTEVAGYIGKRYHAASGAEVTLVDSSKASETCFWRMHYRMSSPRIDLTLYLSPDGQYLAQNLFDLRIDPLVEERARATELMKTLLADGPPSLGPADAPITIVEFSDFQCPYCKRMADILEKDLTPEDMKSIRVVFREFPLPMHPWAKGAAEVAACAGLQSDALFWKVHDYLFQNQATFTAENVRDTVTSFAVANAGVNPVQFQTCLDKKLSVGGVSQDMELGTKSGVHATPTLFINGTKYEGFKDAAQFRSMIADARKSKSIDVKVVATK